MKPLNVVLIGDSILDNKRYTSGQPSVCEHLNQILGSRGTALNLAVDGSVSSQVIDQIRRIPADATHLVLSSGGNDALRWESLLFEPARQISEAFARFLKPVEGFRSDYGKLQKAIQELRTGRPDLRVLSCTIYNGNYRPPLNTVTPIAIAPFNDVIYQLSNEFMLPVLELRSVCTEATDYANPIEPSGPGGRKIAQAIVDWATAITSLTTRSRATVIATK